LANLGYHTGVGGKIGETKMAINSDRWATKSSRFETKKKKEKFPLVKKRTREAGPLKQRGPLPGGAGVKSLTKKTPFKSTRAGKKGRYKP